MNITRKKWLLRAGFVVALIFMNCSRKGDDISAECLHRCSQTLKFDDIFDDEDTECGKTGI